MKSLYGQYISERLGDEIFETKKGFASYRYINNGLSVYILDIFVDPKFRKSGEARKIVESVLKIAKDNGCIELIGSVVPSANNSTNSIKFLLSMDMKLKSSVNDFIVFSKDLV